MSNQSKEEKEVRAAFNKAAEKVNIPERSSLSAEASEAEAVLAPKLDELELAARREFDAAGLSSRFAGTWDILFVEHLIAKGWNVTGNGVSISISG